MGVGWYHGCDHGSALWCCAHLHGGTHPYTHTATRTTTHTHIHIQRDISLRRDCIDVS